MDNKQPKVINKSGTTKLTDEAAAARENRAQREFRGRRRDNRRNRRAAEEGKKEFDTVNISINRVSRSLQSVITSIVSVLASPRVLMLLPPFKKLNAAPRKI